QEPGLTSIFKEIPSPKPPIGPAAFTITQINNFFVQTMTKVGAQESTPIPFGHLTPPMVFGSNFGSQQHQPRPARATAPLNPIIAISIISGHSIRPEVARI